jgi:hypothetical protein
MRGPSPFMQGQCELIATYVSKLNACNCCHTTHDRAHDKEPFGKAMQLAGGLDVEIWDHKRFVARAP